MTIRELVKEEIDALPEESLYVVQEFVLFQKYKGSLFPGIAKIEEQEVQDIARRQTAFDSLMKYHKTLPADFDGEKELLEALDEKHVIAD
jgi:hypothetical protein